MISEKELKIKQVLRRLSPVPPNVPCSGCIHAREKPNNGGFYFCDLLQKSCQYTRLIEGECYGGAYFEEK